MMSSKAIISFPFSPPKKIEHSQGKSHNMIALSALTYTSYVVAGMQI